MLLCSLWIGMYLEYLNEVSVLLLMLYNSVIPENNLTTESIYTLFIFDMEE